MPPQLHEQLSVTLLLAHATKRALGSENTPHLVMIALTATALFVVDVIHPQATAARLSSVARAAIAACRVCWYLTSALAIALAFIVHFEHFQNGSKSFNVVASHRVPIRTYRLLQFYRAVLEHSCAIDVVFALSVALDASIRRRGLDTRHALVWAGLGVDAIFLAICWARPFARRDRGGRDRFPCGGSHLVAGGGSRLLRWLRARMPPRTRRRTLEGNSQQQHSANTQQQHPEIGMRDGGINTSDASMDLETAAVTDLRLESPSPSLSLSPASPSHSKRGRRLFSRATCGERLLLCLVFLLGLVLPLALLTAASNGFSFKSSAEEKEKLVPLLSRMASIIFIGFFRLTMLGLVALTHLDAAHIKAYIRARRNLRETGRTHPSTSFEPPPHVRRQLRTRVDEEALRCCSAGCVLLLDDGSGRTSEHFFHLSVDMSTIRWSWADSILLTDIKDAQRTPGSSLAFTLHYERDGSAVRGDRILSLIAKRPRHAERWVAAVKLLVRAFAEEEGDCLPLGELQRLKAAFRSAAHAEGKAHQPDRLRVLVAGLAQRQALFAMLNRNVPMSKLRMLERGAWASLHAPPIETHRRLPTGAHRLPIAALPLSAEAATPLELCGSFPHVLRLYRTITADATLDALFYSYATRHTATSPPELTLDAFRTLWRDEQCEAEDCQSAAADSEWYQEATDLFVMGCASAKGGLSLAGFMRIIFSRANAALHPKHARVHQDMTQPLAMYFINSSHNTYVTGNQFNSASSADMYRRVITMGCNCVEIDVHDGEAGEPEV